MGFIVRTVSKGKMEKEFKADMEYLMKVWDDVQEPVRRRHGPIASSQRPEPDTPPHP